MLRSVQFFWKTTGVQLLILAGMLIVLVGATLLNPDWLDVAGESIGASVVVSALFGAGLTTTPVNIMLSMGETRKNCFLGFQINLLIYGVIMGLMAYLVALYADKDALYNHSLWMDILTNCIFYLLGAIFSIIALKKKMWLNLLLGIVAWVGFMVYIFTDRISIEGVNWGHLPIFIAGAVLLLVCLCQWYLWRYLKNYCVR